ncbi:MAG: type II secretion system protein [Parcubacteria group bacterium]
MNARKNNIFQLNAQSGFTLMEVMVVLTITIILVAASVPFYSFFQSFGVLNSSKQEVLENVRLTQSKARAGENNSSFGVYFLNNQYTIYQGDSYAGRNQSFDSLNELPTNFRFSGLSEVKFNLKTGLPSTTGDIAIINNSNNATEKISVNSVGLIY